MIGLLVFAWVGILYLLIGVVHGFWGIHPSRVRKSWQMYGVPIDPYTAAMINVFVWPYALLVRRRAGSEET